MTCKLFFKSNFALLWNFSLFANPSLPGQPALCLGCTLYTVDNGEFSIADPICTSQGDSGCPQDRIRGTGTLL